MGMEIEFDETGMTEVPDETEAIRSESEEVVDTTFIAGGKAYEVAFTLGRINLYEKTGHQPIMASFARNGGRFSLDELMSLIAVGTRPLGGGDYVAPKLGMAMAEKIIEANGYNAALGIVVQALERDCGFFFKVTA